jgi:hypothetical protein
LLGLRAPIASDANFILLEQEDWHCMAVKAAFVRNDKAVYAKNAGAIAKV